MTVNHGVVGSSPSWSAFTGVAQSVEHWSPKPGVVSSNLTTRAFFAGIAQLVECQPSKLNVASSSLVARSSYNIAVWCNGSTRDSGSLSLGSSPGTATK